MEINSSVVNSSTENNYKQTLYIFYLYFILLEISYLRNYSLVLVYALGCLVHYILAILSVFNQNLIDIEHIISSLPTLN